MEIELIALTAGAIAGALGGALYWIVPAQDETVEPDSMLKKRIVAGAIVGAMASPILMSFALGVDYATMAALTGIMLAGYGAIDTLKALLGKLRS
jgi:hypothetical protein